MQIENFDATGVPPQQMGDKHPEGTFPARISNTYGQANKNTPGGQFVVELTSPAGSILNRYNLWNENQQAKEIAYKELSALCHAVGIFKLTFKDVPPEQYGRELRGAELSMKVGPQSNNPDYMEVKKIFDKNGNEPGKAPSSAPQTQPAGNSGGNAGGWGTQAQQPAPSSGGGGWSAGPSNNNPAPSGGGSGQAAPPWAK